MDARSAFELADVLRRHGETCERANAEPLGRVERRVTAAIVACGTARLGGHVERCHDCGLTRIYFHGVFTLPPAAAEIAFQNKEVRLWLVAALGGPSARHPRRQTS